MKIKDQFKFEYNHEAESLTDSIIGIESASEEVESIVAFIAAASILTDFPFMFKDKNFEKEFKQEIRKFEKISEIYENLYNKRFIHKIVELHKNKELFEPQMYEEPEFKKEVGHKETIEGDAFELIKKAKENKEFRQKVIYSLIENISKAPDILKLFYFSIINDDLKIIENILIAGEKTIESIAMLYMCENTNELLNRIEKAKEIFEQLVKFYERQKKIT